MDRGEPGYQGAIALLVDDPLGRGTACHGRHADRPEPVGQQREGARAESRSRQRRDDRSHTAHRPAGDGERLYRAAEARLIAREPLDPGREPPHRGRMVGAAADLVLGLGRDPSIVRPDVLHHLRERGHARDRVLGEFPGEGHGAQEFAVDIDRAAAHPLDDPGMFQVAPLEPAEHHVAAGTDVPHHTEHFRLEFLEFRADHHGLTLALHPRA